MFWAVSAKCRMYTKTYKNDPPQWTIAVKKRPCSSWSIANKNTCGQSISLLSFRNLECLWKCSRILLFRNIPHWSAKILRVRGYCWEIETELLPWWGHNSWTRRMKSETVVINNVSNIRNKQPFEVLSEFKLQAGSTPQIVILFIHLLAFCWCCYSS